MGAEMLSLGYCERNDRWNSDEQYYVVLREPIERLDGYIGKGKVEALMCRFFPCL